jgi:ferredoxin
MDKASINRKKCDGCTACIKKCPKEILILTELSDDEIAQLSFGERLTVRWKGRMRAFMQSPELCTGCGVCKKCCHLRAITMNG